MAKVQYQVIDRDLAYEGDKFVVDGVNVQFTHHWVKVGMIVHIALKEDIRPAARPKSGQRQTRYYAPYNLNVIVDPSVCTTCAHDNDAIQTICPNCIESWCWDWFVRFERLWTSHGNYTSYNTYGCRCPECRLANKRYMKKVVLGQDDANVRSVQGRGIYPSVSVTPSLEQKSDG